MKRFFLFLSLCLLSLNAHALTGWSTEYDISIDADIYITSDLTDFPHLVHIDNSAGNDNFWAAVDSTNVCRDIRFTASDGTTLLDFETESCDATNKDGWFHVRVPTTSASINTDIKVWAGNASPSDGIDGAIGRNVTSVWDTSYVSVYHHNQDKNGGAFVDSTSNANNGTNSGTTDIAGKIDKARNFNGSTNYITLTDYSAFGNSITYDIWLNLNSHDSVNGEGVIGVWNSGGKETLIYIDADAKLKCLVRAAGTNYIAVSSTSYPTGTTDHVACIYNGTDVRIYINGSLDGTPLSASGTIDSTTGTWEIGRYNFNNIFGFNGFIDEVTISSSARTLDWVKAKYQSGLQNWITIMQAACTGDGSAIKTTSHGKSTAEIWTSCYDGEFTSNELWADNNGNWQLVDLGGGTYGTSSPVVTFDIKDTGNTSTVWDMSSFRANEIGTTGSIKYQYRHHASDCTLASWNGTWLTRSQMQSESDVTNACIQIKAQFNSNGTQTARLDHLTLAYSPYSTDQDEIVDAYLSKLNPTTKYGSDAGPFKVGYNSGSNDWGNYVVRLPVHLIPRETINSVKLKVYVEYISGLWEGSYDLSIYKLSGNTQNAYNYWSEENVTCNIRNRYLQYSSDKAWAGSACAETAGTDFDSTALDTITLGSGFTSGYVTFTIPLSTIRSWRDNGKNSGLIIRTPERTNTHVANIYPSETATSGKRPYFIIDYTLDAIEPETKRSIADDGDGWSLMWHGQSHSITDGQDNFIISYWNRQNYSSILKYDGHVWDRIDPFSTLTYRSGVIVRGSDGYIHIIQQNGNTLGGAVHEYESLYPDDPYIWKSPLTVTSSDGADKSTASIDSNNTLHFFTETNVTGLGRHYSRTKNGTWSEISTIADTVGTAIIGTSNATRTTSIAVGNDIILGFSRSDETGTNYGYYSTAFLKTSDGGTTWKDSSGNTLTLPLSIEDDDRINRVDVGYRSMLSNFLSIGTDIYAATNATEADGTLGTITIDHFTSTNTDYTFGGATGINGVGQTFDSNANSIGRVCFKLKKTGNPTESLIVSLYDGSVIRSMRQGIKMIKPSDVTTAYQTFCADFPAYTPSDNLTEFRITRHPQSGTSGNNYQISKSDGTYAGGKFIKYNGTIYATSWDDTIGGDLNFQVYKRNAGNPYTKIRKLSSGAWSSIASLQGGYGVISADSDNNIIYLGIDYKNIGDGSGDVIYSTSFNSGSTWTPIKYITNDNSLLDRGYWFVGRNKYVRSDGKVDTIFQTVLSDNPGTNMAASNTTEVSDVFFARIKAVIPPITPPWGWLDQLGSETIH